jgi:P-type Cu2+ transporter
LDVVHGWATQPDAVAIVKIRPESSEAVAELHRLGVRVAMITGDPRAVADSVARRIGIDEVAAEVLPADKAASVKKFQAGGRRVAMVGDGVNDAPALATADVGIAIGAGTDVAIESAGIVLVRSDPRDVIGAIELSRATYRKMIQNLVWATAYNLVAIPVAAGLFVHWGFDLTIIVAANAQLLRGLKLQHDALYLGYRKIGVVRPNDVLFFASPADYSCEINHVSRILGLNESQDLAADATGTHWRPSSS